MITAQTISSTEVCERGRKTLTDYLSLFLPSSWQEPLARLRLILTANGTPDWEALKGQALLFFEERRLSSDRVELLARIERLADAFKDLYAAISPAEWHKSIDDIIHAANFRTSKVAIHTSPFQKIAHDEIEEDDE